MNTLLLFLAALSIHRIWNYEDVAAPVRTLFSWKPFSCEVCNPAWIAAFVAAAGLALGLIPWQIALVFPFAAYLPIRSTVWVYDRIEGVPEGRAANAPKKAKGCSGCAQKQADLAAQREKAMAYRERIVVITTHKALFPRLAMLAAVLARDKERQVQVWLSAATTPDALNEASRQQSQLGTNVVVRAVTPFAPDEQRDQLADEKTVAQLSGEIGMQLMSLGNAKVLTVDALYDPHLLPLAQAIHQFGQTKAFAWVHLASGEFGWDRPADPAVAAARATIPENHLAIVPAVFAQDARKYYQAGDTQVRVAGGPDVIADIVAGATPIA